MDLYDNPKPVSPPNHLDPPKKLSQFEQTSTSSISITEKLRLLKSSSKFTDDTSDFAENSLRSQPSFKSIWYDSPAQNSQSNHEEADLMSTQ